MQRLCTACGRQPAAALLRVVRLRRLCLWCRNWLVYAPLCVLGTYALKHWAGYLWFDVWYPDADPGPAGVIFGYPEYVATISLCAFGCIRLLMGFWKKRPAQ